jgi:hypothetical protein
MSEYGAASCRRCHSFRITISVTASEAKQSIFPLAEVNGLRRRCRSQPLRGLSQAMTGLKLPIQFSNSDAAKDPRSRGAMRPSFASISALARTRAQGKPGADCTRGSRAKKSTGVGPQVQPETSGFPCAMVYGL